MEQQLENVTATKSDEQHTLIYRNKYSNRILQKSNVNLYLKGKLDSK